jgi:pilus assembly protein CpaF
VTHLDLPVAQLGDRLRSGSPPSQSLDATLLGERTALLGQEGTAAALTRWRSELVGLGPLEALIADEEVTDILVNGDGSTWVDRGDGLVLTSVAIGELPAVRRLAVRLAGLAGRRLDDSQPWVDGEVAPGIRLHAVLPPIAPSGAHISLRIGRRAGWTLDALADREMFAEGVEALLRRLVARRVSFLVSGGTGSGKSSLLAALLAASDDVDRIVVVEDVNELRVAHPHVVSLQGRSPNVEGVGSVTMVDLVRQALRMRPDRLVVGEARGAEIREFLSALNTGHDGGCGTIHANRVADVPARVAALGALAGLDEAASAAQLRSAVRVVVHVSRRGGQRVVESIGVVGAGPGATDPPVEVVPALVVSQGRVERGPAWRLLSDLLARETG